MLSASQTLSYDYVKYLFHSILTLFSALSTRDTQVRSWIMYSPGVPTLFFVLPQNVPVKSLV